MGAASRTIAWPNAGHARPGRPPLGQRAQRTITIRLDPDVLEAYRATGPGWQTCINADLRRASALKPMPA